MLSVSLMLLEASGSVKAPSVAQVDVLVLLGHHADRRVHVQDDVAGVVDLRRHVQRDAARRRAAGDATVSCCCWPRWWWWWW
jgi:hypothetical protein